MHQSYSIQSSFTQKVRLQQIRSLTEDIRFYYKRLRNNKDELEPRRKSKVVRQFISESHVLFKNTCLFPFLHPFQVANIYFDASLQCGDHCYVGLPFVLKCKRVFFFLFSLFRVSAGRASREQIFLTVNISLRQPSLSLMGWFCRKISGILMLIFTRSSSDDGKS